MVTLKRDRFSYTDTKHDGTQPFPLLPASARQKPQKY